MENTPAKNTEKWYFRTSVLVIGFLCIGPFILPLVWFNPKFNAAKKTAISAAVIAVSIILTTLLAGSLKNIGAYYGQLFQELRELRQMK